jgi:hypothetical protein
VFLAWIPAGENAVAGQSRLSGTAYRVFEIAAFIPAPAYREAGTKQDIRQHFSKALT